MITISSKSKRIYMPPPAAPPPPQHIPPYAGARLLLSCSAPSASASTCPRRHTAARSASRCGGGGGGLLLCLLQQAAGLAPTRLWPPMCSCYATVVMHCCLQLHSSLRLSDVWSSSGVPGGIYTHSPSVCLSLLTTHSSLVCAAAVGMA